VPSGLRRGVGAALFGRRAAEEVGRFGSIVSKSESEFEFRVSGMSFARRIRPSGFA
jgi:hypothetical protein